MQTHVVLADVGQNAGDEWVRAYTSRRPAPEIRQVEEDVQGHGGSDRQCETVEVAIYPCCAVDLVQI